MQGQIVSLASVYLRKGGTVSRRKQVNLLIDACKMIQQRFKINRVDQIGQKQIRWHYEQLRQAGRADKTRLDYFYAWCQLWSWLNRSGQPVKPKPSCSNST